MQPATPTIHTTASNSLGGVVCIDPLVTIGKYAPAFDQPLGLLSIRPDLFRGRSSLNFMGLMGSHENLSKVTQLAQYLEAGKKEFPQAEFVILANTQEEARLIGAQGIQVVHANELIFTREDRYACAMTPGGEYDAAYVAGFLPYKRHELAVNVPSLLLIGYKTDKLDVYRRLLPNAMFANYASGEYILFNPTQISQLLHRCAVGLCLSAVEGAMRASVEYLICGLPVVTTESLGGRDRYLRTPHALTVSADPAAVAEAVAWLKAKAFAPQAIRNNVQEMLTADRHVFDADISRTLKAILGRNAPALGFKEFSAASPIKRRPADVVFAGLK